MKKIKTKKRVSMYESIEPMNYTWYIEDYSNISFNTSNNKFTFIVCNLHKEGKEFYFIVFNEKELLRVNELHRYKLKEYNKEEIDFLSNLYK